MRVAVSPYSFMSKNRQDIWLVGCPVGALYLQVLHPRVQTTEDQNHLIKNSKMQIHSICTVLSFINNLEVISSTWEDVS